MARKSWKPYRIVFKGQSIEVNAAEFHGALGDNLTRQCDRDRRKAYVRHDLVMHKDAASGSPRFALRDKPEFDPYAIKSSWALIERIAAYFVEPVYTA
jgi:hypothetical protein